MSDDYARDDHKVALDGLVSEVEREAERVGVDWSVAAEQLRAAAPQHERVAPGGESSEISVGLDVTGLLRTLRSLPAHAGTARFVAAMTADRSEFEPPPA